MHFKLKVNSALITALVLMGCVSVSGCNEDDDDKFVQTVFTVKNSIEAVEIEAKGSIISVDETLPFSAMATKRGQEALEDVSANVSWSSSDAAIAIVSDAGEVTGIGAGTVIITAQLADLIAEATLTVSSAELLQIQIQASAETVSACTDSTSLTATGLYSDETERDLTELVAWTVSDDTLARVNEAKLVSLKQGTVDVMASYRDVDASALPLFIEQSLATITVTPENAFVGQGNQEQYTAIATYNDGLQGDITDIATWYVLATDGSGTNVVAISDDIASKALLTASSSNTGEATVSASCDDVTASTSVNVYDESEVSDLTINDGETTLTFTWTGEDIVEQLSAEAILQDGSTEDVTDDGFWFVADSVEGITIGNDTGSKGELTITGTGTTVVKVSYGKATAEINIVVD